MRSLSVDIRKYVRYVLDAKSFDPSFSSDGISDQAFRAARAIRGEGRAPALIIHGIMPRSGTVYVGELLKLHPDLYAYPNQLWEVPFLQLTGDMLDLQQEFLWGHRHNIGKMGDKEFLPLFGASIIAYLYSSVPSGKRMLLKVPSVQYLSYFYSVFPYENLLLLVRDGRDVVQSTIKTWPQLRFSFVCRRWRRSAGMVAACHRHYSGRANGYWLARFEDAVRDPAAFVEEACAHFGLDVERYPFGQIEAIPLRGSSSTPVSGEIVWAPVDKPEAFKPTRNWEGWSIGRKRTFKRIAGKSLIELGYCQDLKW